MTPPASRIPARLELALLAFILLAALGLRVYRLAEVPPGLTHDEAAHGHDAAAVAAGFRPIYFTVGYGREPAFDYFNAGLFSLLGKTALVLRGSAVFWGLAALGAAYLWARLAFGVPVALGTAALVAVSFWPLAVSRQALRSGMLPGLFALAACAWWAYYYVPRTPLFAKQQGSVGPGRVSKALALAAFPLLIAATLYTYLPARGLWLLFPLFLVYLALTRRPSAAPLAPLAARTLLALAAAAALAAPLFGYLRAHPGAEQRLTMLDAPLQALGRGDLGPLLENARGALLMFFWPGWGDHFLAYTIPGKPIFDPVLFALFALGVGLAAWRCLSWRSGQGRQPAHAFSLLWLAVGLGPSLLTGPEAATTRSLGALPVVYLFPALAAVELIRFTTQAQRHAEQESRIRDSEPQRREGRKEKGVGAGDYASRITHYALRFTFYGLRITHYAFFLLLAATAALTYRDYFARWGAAPEVRAAYQSTLLSELAYLEGRPEGGAVVLSSVYPGAAHDPYIAEMALARRDLRLRWTDGRAALLFPSAARARLLAPASAALDPHFARWLGAPAARLSQRPDDLDPYFDVYDWQPVEAYRQALDEAGPAAVRVQGIDLLRLPVTFGSAVELEAYQWLTLRPAPGATADLLTFWRVTDPAAVGPRVPPAFETDAVLFVHVLAGDGSIVAQQDRLDAPSWDWQTGDRIAQIFRLPLPGGLAPGEYEVEVGLYNRVDGLRLPVSAGDGVVLDDHVRIAPLVLP